ncbi:hypothetical protein FJV41_41480 [Myxococcus llanfairpwllgwyngyllgogerychwyrndrobwllllantysiliogogogochensis]|uniref:Uncharacterized protein n=1 Tax=Myxococcus llanfairpwllgwyngyllgogerychwyrndrobwllllantysiliogogogochensis TaxID=2590453 RepID=A0A540WNM4_9BACT|nr:hypothetical protein [Myxococcus llanfairpwllgwyngyllgogerychwyrndrobwllllantysiliogogogochensis]TQF10044.1 hypothetical protein FJV41_41480 [Myxococcus llanfairpwllgwyngyllgogerychwyrndrobwllllantysiliogogogochensis]
MRDTEALARQAEAFFSEHPGVSLMALGAGEHAESMDLSPLGLPATYLPAERNLELATQYLALNQFAFGGIGVPRWVLSDLYLMPGAIGLLRCPARMLKPELRAHLGLADEEPAIGAAYYAAPSMTPGLFIGVSLLSFLPGTGAGAWVKTLTLRMLRATRLRGVAQWDNPSVRVHARLGPLRLVGRVPGGHEYGERTFVYETDLSDGARVAEAMERRLSLEPTRRIAVTDLPALSALLDRAEAGEALYLVPPGVQDGHVLVREGAH